MTKLGVSPITNKIYYGQLNKAGTMWVGTKKDITDNALSSVFEWFYNQMDGKSEFSITFPDVKGFTLKMVKEEEKEEQ